MTVKYVQWMPFIPCKHPFLAGLKDKNSLPQCQQLNKFITDNNITDISYDYSNGRHRMIALIVNDQYCSLDSLRTRITEASLHADRYLYIAVNKFFIFSPANTLAAGDNYDTKLVSYCQWVVADKFKLLDYTVRPDDDGLLGNFVHPVTTMFFKKYD